MEKMAQKQIRCPVCGSSDVMFTIDLRSCGCFQCQAKFPVPVEADVPSAQGSPTAPEEGAKGRRIFLSYGHTEDVICQRIVAALREHHYDPWYDHDPKKLPDGVDWRKAIVDGLLNCGGVVSCLSKHSVRDPGVCLNELGIVIGARGGNITTILLEPESEVRPPASLCHIQWLDMSRWREYYEEGDEAFEPWFADQMRQLIDVLERDETAEFVGDITAIRKKLHVNHSTSKQMCLLEEEIVGREWLVAEIEKWLDDKSGRRLCVLYGDPGVGKSAFAAKFIHYNPRVVAGLFQEHGKTVYNDVRTIIMTMAYLLACRLPAYRIILKDRLEYEDRMGDRSAEDLFDLLLATPLSSQSINVDHETLCIVIDGVDECGEGEWNALAEILQDKYVKLLPDWLRILAITRDVAAVRGPLEGSFQLELRGDQEQNRLDIREYFRNRLEGKFGADPNWPEALRALVERSGGIFLYAALVSAGILAGNLPINDPSRFPVGLAATFHDWFRWIFPDHGEYDRTFRVPLAALVAAPEPLPEEELRRVFGWDDNQVDDFVRRIEVLLHRGKNDFGQATLSPSHQYLAEWLDTERAEGFRSRRSAAVERMATRFHALFLEDCESITPFEALYMLPLLEQSGQRAKREDLLKSHDLCWVLIKHGNDCAVREKLDLALQYYAQAQTIAEHMAALQLEFGRYNLCIAYGRTASIYEEKGDFNRALQLLSLSLPTAEQLAQEQSVPINLRLLSVFYDSVAGIHMKRGDLDGAFALYEKEMQIDAQLAQEQNTVSSWFDLTVSYRNIGNYYAAKGKLREAQALFEKNLEIAEWMIGREISPLTRRALDDSYCDIGYIRRESGDLGGALEMFQKCCAIVEEMMAESPAPEHKSRLRFLYLHIAGVYAKQKKTDMALEWCRKSLAIDEALSQEQRTPRNLRAMCDSYTNIGFLLSNKGELAEAAEMFEKSFSIREHILREQDTPENWRSLMDGYKGMLAICSSLFDVRGAMDYNAKCIQIAERLVQEQGAAQDRDNLERFRKVQRRLELMAHFEWLLKTYKWDLKFALWWTEKSRAALNRLPENRRNAPGMQRLMKKLNDRAAKIRAQQQYMERQPK